MNEKHHEINEIYSDIFQYRIPKRLPITLKIKLNAILAYYGFDTIGSQYDYAKCREVALKCCEDFPLIDDFSLGNARMTMARNPISYGVLGAINFQMGSNGMMQHPETHSLEASEYDRFILDPYKCIKELILPRLYKSLSASGIDAANAVAIARESESEDSYAFNTWYREIVQTKHYYEGAKPGSSGKLYVPCDFLADQIRGFTCFSVDLRRCRDKVIDAIESLTPYVLKMSFPASPHYSGSVVTPIHMPAFMRCKDFEEVWMPTARKCFREYAAKSIRPSAVLEHNWNHLIDYLGDVFPEGSQLLLETIDKKRMKDTYGSKFILTDGFNLDTVKYANVDELEKEVRSYLDLMMPGGNFIFGIDKNILSAGDFNVINLRKLNELVMEYGSYGDMAGRPTGTILNREGFVHDESLDIADDCIFSWSDYKRCNPYAPDSAESRIRKYYEKEFCFNMSLLL